MFFKCSSFLTYLNLKPFAKFCYHNFTLSMCFYFRGIFFTLTLNFFNLYFLFCFIPTMHSYSKSKHINSFIISFKNPFCFNVLFNNQKHLFFTLSSLGYSSKPSLLIYYILHLPLFIIY
jgi:hypothetical protein